MTVAIHLPTGVITPGPLLDWINVWNIITEDATNGQSYTGPGGTVINHFTNFGFDIVMPPGSTIDAVKVTVRHNDMEFGTDPGFTTFLALVGGVELAGHTLPQRTSMTTDTVDITADRAWTRDDLLDGVFKVELQGMPGSDSNVAADYFSVEVTFTEPTLPEAAGYNVPGRTRRQ